MTALPGEIEGAVAEGIEIVTLKAPASLDVGEDHKIHGIYATPQMISAIREPKGSAENASVLANILTRVTGVSVPAMP